jgi:hypothetical protein
MDDLTVIFEEQRTHLHAVAYRVLGSVHEADDAVQEIPRVRAAVPDRWVSARSGRLVHRRTVGAKPASDPLDI